ncbi:prepilin-type N-terminal cleavage/methylation domain-containing protein [Desulfothermus sp.]
MNTKQINKYTGFTLIELLVSLAICSILLVGLYISFINILDFSESVDTDTILINMDNMLTILLDRDISSIYTDPNEIERFKLQGKNQIFDNANILTFYTSNSLINRPAAFSINKIEYCLKKNEEKDDYSLYRVEIPFGNLDLQDKKIFKIKVADYIKNINIFFFDKNGSQHDFWDIDDMKSMPVAILIELSFELKGKTHKLKHLFSVKYNEK